MVFCLYELAKQPHILHKFQLEIDTVLNQQFRQTYLLSIYELNYLEYCFDGLCEIIFILSHLSIVFSVQIPIRFKRSIVDHH